jgi:hypothetical protein
METYKYTSDTLFGGSEVGMIVLNGDLRHSLLVMVPVSRKVFESCITMFIIQDLKL